METNKQTADLFFPATASLRDHQNAFIEWLPRQEYLPTDAFEEISFVQQELVYLPLYRISGQFNATYRCQIDNDGEQAQPKADPPQPGQGQKAGSLVDLWPFSGSIPSQDYVLHACAFQSLDWVLSGTWYIDEALLSFCEKIGAHIQPDPLDGRNASDVTRIPFEVSPEDAFEVRIKSQLDAQIQTAVESAASAYRDIYSGLRWDANISREFVPYYAPVWLTHYVYNNSSYYFLSSGLHSSDNLGTTPHSKETKNAAKKYYLPYKLSLIPSIFFLALFAASIKTYIFPAFVFVALSIILTIVGDIRKALFLDKQKEQLRLDQAEARKNPDPFFAQSPPLWSPQKD